MSLGVASLLVVQVVDVDGVAVIEAENRLPVGADCDRREPGTQPDVVQFTAIPPARVDKWERAVEMI